ncbi:sigma-70 family RNA polymerase sigma factor [Reyranella sp.]|uniref:sigma-70 family RNA polymerase sigma factor n=1 Tax=Reyranella sp. TaxID=1929291 RepID=UPI003BA9F005
MPDESRTLSVFLAHRLRLVDYAQRIVGDHSRAEDVVQEAYLRFDSASRGRPFDEPLAYLYRIVRNLALDGLRQRTRESRFMIPADAADTDRAVDARPSPEAQAAGRSDLVALRAAIAELPPRARLALEFHRLEGQTIKEVAARLGISVGAAHGLIVDSLEYCRDRIQRRP